MNKTVKDLVSQNEARIEKSISMTDVNSPVLGAASSLTPRQDLDSVLLSIANRNTPFRDMVKREAGQGAAFTFNLRASLFASGGDSDPRDAAYSDGNLPTDSQSQYYTVTTAFKEIGYKGGITGLSEAVGESLVDLYAEEVEATTRRVIQAEEWLDFWGDNTVAGGISGGYAYSGLDKLITTNVVDAQGAAISKTLIDQACNLIGNKGGTADKMFTSFRVSDQINNLYNSAAQVIINQGGRDSLTYGNYVTQVRTSVGVLDVISDFFINPGNTYITSSGSASSPSGLTTSTVFILNMNYISMKDLKGLGMEELGRVADKREFYVNEYTAMKLKAEPWCAKITNVKDTY